ASGRPNNTSYPTAFFLPAAPARILGAIDGIQRPQPQQPNHSYCRPPATLLAMQLDTSGRRGSPARFTIKCLARCSTGLSSKLKWLRLTRASSLLSSLRTNAATQYQGMG